MTPICARNKGGARSTTNSAVPLDPPYVLPLRRSLARLIIPKTARIARIAIEP
jgi:hypothetical protein